MGSGAQDKGPHAGSQTLIEQQRVPRDERIGERFRRQEAQPRNLGPRRLQQTAQLGE